MEIYKIKLINKIRETSDIYTFEFEIQDKMIWRPGQYSKFMLTNHKVEGRNDRIFSIASIKEENEIMFSTRIGEQPSDFKRVLNQLQHGEIIEMTHPMGDFCVKEYNRPICMIAGGIGIPPIRALLKDAITNRDVTEKIEVLYSDNRKEYAYLDFLKSLNQKCDLINIEFIYDINTCQQKTYDFIEKYGQNAFYYISGSPAMIEANKKDLLERGVSKENIKFDSFFGY